MTLHRRVFAVLAAVTAATLSTLPPAFACKCALVPRDRTIIATPLVFEGHVLRVETTRETGPAAQVTTLMVVRSVKGMSSGEVVMISTQTESASCGFDFREAKSTLLVGAYRDGQGRLSVHRCTMYNLNR